MKQANCHWRNCKQPATIARWGCKKHWYQLPHEVRSKIRHAYRPKEATQTDLYYECVRDAYSYLHELEEQEKLQTVATKQIKKIRKCLGPDCNRKFLTTREIRLCYRCKHLNRQREYAASA